TNSVATHSRAILDESKPNRPRILGFRKGDFGSHPSLVIVQKRKFQKLHNPAQSCTFLHNPAQFRASKPRLKDPFAQTCTTIIVQPCAGAPACRHIRLGLLQVSTSTRDGRFLQNAPSCDSARRSLIHKRLSRLPLLRKCDLARRSRKPDRPSGFPLPSRGRGIEGEGWCCQDASILPKLRLLSSSPLCVLRVLCASLRKLKWSKTEQNGARWSTEKTAAPCSILLRNAPFCSKMLHSRTQRALKVHKCEGMSRNVNPGKNGN